MADLDAGPDIDRPAAETGEAGAERVAGLFRARYPEMVRLADLLGADDPEDMRDALSERATFSPIDPDAWERTLARSRRRWRPGRIRVRAGMAAPLAAAAAIVAIVVAVTSVADAPPAGHPSQARTSAPVPTPSPTGTPCKVDGLRSLCTSEVVTVRQGSGARATVSSYYFAYLINPRTGKPDLSLDFCAMVNLQHPGPGSTGGGGCSSGSPGQDQVASSANASPVLNVQFGLAARQITSVTAVLTNGRRGHGVVVSGRGFAYKAWQVSYPVADPATLLFVDAAGRQVGKLFMAASDGSFNPLARPSGGIALFRVAAGMVSAYLVNGLITFSVDNTWDGAFPAKGWPAVTGLLGSGSYWAGNECFGYVHPGVARVAIRLTNGFQTSVSTFVPGWPGSGVRFFAAALPRSFFPWGSPNPSTEPQGFVTAYDSAGRVMAREPLIGTGP